MSLVAELTAVAAAKTGRLKFITREPASLSGLQEIHPGWVLCNGAAIPNSGRYAALYAMIGTKFGVAGTLPAIIDGRVPIPKGASVFPTAGVAGGEITHVLTLAEYPNHSHSRVDNTPGAGSNSNGAGVDGYDPYDHDWFGGPSRSSGSFGGGGSHANMPPYTVVGAVLVKL